MALQSRKEDLYELLFLRASEGLIIANRDGVIEMANPRANVLFGYEENGLIGQNVDSLLPKHLKEKHTQHRENYLESPHQRPMGLGYDLIGVRKDGSSFPLEISLNHFTDDGETKVMALIMDVTRRKEQEAEIMLLNKHLEKRVAERTKELNESQKLYRMIARNFPNGTINVFDRELNYVFAEGGEMYRYGITSEKLMGRNYIDRLPDELQEMMREKLGKVFKGESLKFELKFKNQFYLINTTGLANQQGEIDRILLVEQNITERKKAEEATEDALQKEKQLNELKSRFVSMASHEFRTPLSTVLSSLSLIEKYDQSGATEKKEKHYKRIKTSVRHLTNILNDFLSLEKVETGKVYMSSEEINVKEVLEDIVDQHAQITKSNQRIAFNFVGIEHIHTDQNMLQIICSNLLSNAIKYSGEGKHIDLSAECLEDALTINVRDEGIGIPEEEQDNMFSRFFRAKNAVNIEGTGLGLNIVNRYTQLLGGSIHFQSRPEEGTTFTVTIPNHKPS
jgi:PAS domain S-box-containing protein